MGRLEGNTARRYRLGVASDKGSMSRCLEVFCLQRNSDHVFDGAANRVSSFRRRTVADSWQEPSLIEAGEMGFQSF